MGSLQCHLWIKMTTPFSSSSSSSPSPFNSAPVPRGATGTPFEATARALLELLLQMERLHAQLQYLKLLRKLGVKRL
jgi:hypothetical protein